MRGLAEASAVWSHPPLPQGSVSALPYWVRKCWQRLTLQRLALTEEMVLYLVIFEFFPGVLASFSPHVLNRSTGLRGVCSQTWDFGERRRRQGCGVRLGTSYFPWGHWFDERNSVLGIVLYALPQGQGYLISDLSQRLVGLL